MDIKRGENESKFEYIKRITSAKRDKTADLDYSEWSNLCFDKEYSSDVARRMFYGIEKLIDAIGNDNVINVSDDELFKQLEVKKRELEKEKIKFQDERREYKKYLRFDSRYERQLDTIKECVKTLPELDYDKFYNGFIGNVNASLLFSDFHYGIVCNNYWNKFNTTIAKQRVVDLTQRTIKYCKQNEVTTLHLELLGDLISGNIHRGIAVENEENVIQQTTHVSEIIASMINELANKIDNVKVYLCCGNHGRTNPNKNDSIEEENFESLIWDFIKLRVNRDDVEFVENDLDDTMIHYVIDGEHIIGVHGHLDKAISMASNFSRMFKFPIKELHIGHLHHFNENDDYDIATVMNGTISGVDTYSKNIRKTGSPMQVLRIYNGEDVIIHKIRLG